MNKESVAEQVERVFRLLIDEWPSFYEEQRLDALLARVWVMEADAAAAGEAKPFVREFLTRIENGDVLLPGTDLVITKLSKEWHTEYDARHPEAQP